MPFIEVQDGVALIDANQWVRIKAIGESESPNIRGGTPIFYGAEQKKVIDEPSRLKDRTEFADPPLDPAAWDDFINGRITESVWRDRQRAFGDSNGFGYILDGIGGNKVFETDRDRYDRLYAQYGPDDMPRHTYWTTERSHYEPSHFDWQGVPTSNGGNWHTLPGNIIEMDLKPEVNYEVQVIRPDVPANETYLILGGAVEEPQAPSRNPEFGAARLHDPIFSTPAGKFGRPLATDDSQDDS